MNKGIKEYCKILSHKAADAVDVLININKSDANFHINIPIYSSNNNNPINLDLMFTLSEVSSLTDTIFGRGIKLNIFKYIKGQVSSNTLSIMNQDGSIDVFNKTYNNNYINNENYLRIEDKSDYRLLLDKYRNKYYYILPTVNSSYYPYRIENNNGDLFNLNIGYPDKINSITNNKGEIAYFFYENGKVKNIEIKNNNALIFNVSFEYLDNYLRKVTYNNGKVNLYSIQLLLNVNPIEIINDLTLSRVKYTIVNNRVNEYINGYDDSYIGGVKVNIDYADKYTTIKDYRSENIYCFKTNNLPILHIDDKLRTTSYTYGEYNRLESISDIQENRYEIANENNLLKNGYFKVPLDDSENKWSKAGDGIFEIITNTSNDNYINLGNHIKITNNTTDSLLYQYIYKKGSSHNYFTFILWAKKLFDLSNGTNVKIKVGFHKDLKPGSEEVSFKEIDFSSNNSNYQWIYKTFEVNPEGDYDFISVKIIVMGANTSYIFNAIQLYQKPYGVFYEYNGIGNITKQRYGLFEKKISYSINNMPIQTLNEDSSIANYIYDNNGNVIRAELENDLIANRVYVDNNLINEKIEYYSEFIESSYNYNLESIENTDILIDTLTDSSDNTIELKYDKYYRLPNEVEDAKNNKTTYNYYENNLPKLLTVSDNINNSYIEYKYSTKNVINDIILKNGVKYHFENDEIDRTKYVEVGNIPNDMIRLVEYEYDEDKDFSGAKIYSNRVTSKQHGINGDKYIFIYDSEEKIDEIRLHKKSMDPELGPVLLYDHEYDYKGRLIKQRDLINNDEIRYKYDQDNQLTQINDIFNNSINYVFNIYGELYSI